MTYVRSALVCPFCGLKGGEFPPHEVCGGSFLARDHPTAVRPILMDLDGDGEFIDMANQTAEERLAQARARYR